MRFLWIIFLTNWSLPASADCRYILSANFNQSIYVELARDLAIEARIDPKLILAQIKVESNFNPVAVSSVGAQGLLQIMPETQIELDMADPFHPVENIRGGIRYLKMQLTQFSSVRKALWVYHNGPDNVQNGTVGPKGVQYATDVLNCYRSLKKQLNSLPR